ncbi:hypothetical protein BC835DRAFT_1285482, partial [Cytidiella melzeri]
MDELSHETATKLQILRSLLSSLPHSIPDGRDYYGFEGFTPSRAAVDDYGEEGALNHAMEIAFCPRGCQKDVIVFKEQGPGLVAIVSTLEKYLTRFPMSAILLKWVDDLTEAA